MPLCSGADGKEPGVWARGTLEERIDQLIERKRGLAERIVGAGDAWLTELSPAELRRLVALDRDAVPEG